MTGCDHDASLERWRRCATWLAGIAAALACIGLWRRLGIDDGSLTDIVVDDALYYLLPAQHFVAGHGFAFDGIHRSNGVQPLWAMVSVAIAGCSSDWHTAIRLACAISGLSWIGAGLVLFGTCRRQWPGAGLLLLVLWLLASTWRHLGSFGMENGLHGLLFASLLALALRTRAAAEPRVAPFARLGLLAGLFGLSRTEAALAAPLLAVAVLIGWLGELRPDRRLQWRAALGFTAAAAVPLVAWYGASLCYFGELLPISGSVKLFYEALWPARFDSLAQSLWWHAGRIFEIAAHGGITAIERIARGLGAGVDADACRRMLAIVVGAGAVTAAVRVVLARRRLPAAAAVLAVFALFALAHLLLISALLPHFSDYGCWYFGCEVLAAQALMVAALLGLLPWQRWRALAGTAPLVLAVLLLAGAGSRLTRRPTVRTDANAFVTAGRWLQMHVPAPQRIGSLSSGYLGFAAPNHSVVNLDGLINDGHYLRQYLAQDRLADYLHDERIGWFADLAPIEAWSHGLHWCGAVPLSDMRLAKWWPRDDRSACCIFRLWPQDDAMAFDPFARLQFDAVAGAAARTCAQLPSDLDAGSFIASSVASMPSGRLLHVVMPWAEYVRVAPSVAEVLPEQPADARFGDRLRCLGVTVERGRRDGIAFMVLSRYWQWLGGAVPGSLRVAVQCGGRDLGQTPLAHGSIRDVVPTGTVLMDAVRLDVPDGGGIDPASLRLAVLVDGAPLRCVRGDGGAAGCWLDFAGAPADAVR